MKYPVSNIQKQVILGSLLGDGYFVRSKGNSGNNSLRWRHGASQYSYLEWKHSLMGDLKGSGVKSQTSNTFGKTREICYAVCKYSNKFNPFAELIGKPKRVTRKLLNLLDPLGLAIWFMDDGSLDFGFRKNKAGETRVSRRRAILCTNSFSLEEHWIMQRYFKVVWNIDVAIHKSNKTQYNLVFNSTNAKLLIDLISSHVPECMSYKIDLNRTCKLTDRYNAERSDIKNYDIVCSSMKVEEVPEMSDPLPAKEV